MKKASEIWPKRPIWIVVWVEGEIRGYGVVSKHSKRVPACGFCAVQVPLPEQSKLLAGARVSGGDCKNSTRQGAVFGLPKSLSLRVSPQTGAAIRFQNVQFLCLFAGLQLKDYGFPRRFAPRNDRDGFPDKQKNSTRRGAVFGLSKKSVIARQSAPRSKCPWGTDWRGNPSHLRAGCHTRL